MAITAVLRSFTASVSEPSAFLGSGMRSTSFSGLDEERDALHVATKRGK